MYCTRKVNEDITWVGGNDRRLAMFEGVYSIPDGVSYNSYLILDEKTILFDTTEAVMPMPVRLGTLYRIMGISTRSAT